MASLQARHSRSCELRWTTFEFDRERCTCSRGPTYYVCDPQIRGGKVRVGRDRKVAKRMLARIQTRIDEGTYERVKKIGFATWADEWLSRLDSITPGTRSAYKSSMNYAKDFFREKEVNRITTTDIADFNRHLRDDFELSPTTRHKHVSTLSTCLSSALAHGYASSNPVAALPRNERPKKLHSEAAYFENKELEKLVRAMSECLEKDACLLALMTGMRQGEILGLKWSQVDLKTATIRVRRSYGARVKHGKERDVDLPLSAVRLLARRRAALKAISIDSLVFPPLPGSRAPFFPYSALNRFLEVSMKSAGVRLIGPNDRKRTFHSLRHTFAKTALEQGIPLTWLRRQLGHSTITVTDTRYGHWERQERKRVAEKLSDHFAKFMLDA
jgi:integrase